MIHLVVESDVLHYRKTTNRPVRARMIFVRGSMLKFGSYQYFGISVLDSIESEVIQVVLSSYFLGFHFIQKLNQK